MACCINPQKMKTNSNQMNKLGQQIFRAFAAGSVEELAAALEVIIRENSAPVDCGALPKVRKWKRFQIANPSSRLVSSALEDLESRIWLVLIFPR